MKASVKQIVSAYNTLGEAAVTKLEEGEAIKVVKARKVMRPIVEDYEAFLKDCQEKFKPENWDSIMTKLQQWQKEGEKTTLTEEERIEINKVVIEYQSKIDKAVADELKKEHEINAEKFADGTDVKLLLENGWKSKQLDAIDILL